MSSCLGIDARRLDRMTFAYGAALAGLAGAFQPAPGNRLGLTQERGDVGITGRFLITSHRVPDQMIDLPNRLACAPVEDVELPAGL